MEGGVSYKFFDRIAPQMHYTYSTIYTDDIFFMSLKHLIYILIFQIHIKRGKFMTQGMFILSTVGAFIYTIVINCEWWDLVV